jgi:hypothetical protein
MVTTRYHGDAPPPSQQMRHLDLIQRDRNLWLSVEMAGKERSEHSPQQSLMTPLFVCGHVDRRTVDGEEKHIGGFFILSAIIS